MYDDLFSFWQSTQTEFFKVSTTQAQDYAYVSSLNKNMVEIDFKLDRTAVRYVRIVETVFGIMEKIGGFKETVFSVIGLMVVFFQERLFKGAFLKQLYQRKS